MLLRIICIGSFIVVGVGNSQTYSEKNEKEERVTLIQLPQETQNTLKLYPKNIKRLKFYRETDGDKVSFETKFKYHKKWHSIEYDTIGTLEDIEIEINKNKLPQKAYLSIKNYLNNLSQKWKIIKIQEQYINNNTSAKELINGVILNNLFNPNYEIIIEISQKKSVVLKEFIFDVSGKFISVKKLQQADYQHVQY